MTRRRAVGIVDDRVPTAPEGVIRRLVASVASAGQVGVDLVDGVAGRHPEPENRATPVVPPHPVSHWAKNSVLSHSMSMPPGRLAGEGSGERGERGQAEVDEASQQVGAEEEEGACDVVGGAADDERSDAGSDADGGE